MNTTDNARLGAAQQAIIEALRDGPLGYAQIGEKVGRGRPQVRVAVQALEKRGLVAVGPGITTTNKVTGFPVTGTIVTLVEQTG